MNTDSNDTLKEKAPKPFRRLGSYADKANHEKQSKPAYVASASSLY